MERYLLVALGGALGSLLRYGLGAWVQGSLGAGFPWSTLFVNALGSFLIGLTLRLSLAGALSGEVGEVFLCGFGILFLVLLLAFLGYRLGGALVG